MNKDIKKINGVILLDKPKGISSNCAVNIVKKSVGGDKAGHLGTLDVAGHGLLPVTLGKSTKIFEYFLNKDKVYQASFKFGVETDTFDLEGQIVKTDDKIISEQDILSVLPKLIGKQNQMPPIYSAKKIKGRKAYDLAREGKEVILKPKAIEIYDLKLIGQLDVNEFLFEIHCSSGTYIRSLCRDMAVLLSTCGVMSDIIRTKCGKLELKNAFLLEEIKNGKYEIISPEKLFENEEIILNKINTDKVLNGVIIDIDQQDGEYKIFSSERDFIGLGKINSGRLKIILRLI